MTYQTRRSPTDGPPPTPDHQRQPPTPSRPPLLRRLVPRLPCQPQSPRRGLRPLPAALGHPRGVPLPRPSSNPSARPRRSPPQPARRARAVIPPSHPRGRVCRPPRRPRPCRPLVSPWPRRRRQVRQGRPHRPSPPPHAGGDRLRICRVGPQRPRRAADRLRLMRQRLPATVPPRRLPPAVAGWRHARRR